MNEERRRIYKHPLDMHPAVEALSKLTEPIIKFLDITSKGIGTWYKPIGMRREADSKAYEIEKINEANAKGRLLDAKTDGEVNDIVKRAKQRLVQQETNRQTNLESIADKAYEHLGDIVSEEPVDPDWTTRFFSQAQDIGNEKMQEIWAKILASEISKPGSISIRTMSVLNNLDKEDAEAFQSVTTISFDDKCIIKKDSTEDFRLFGISTSDMLRVRLAGLIFESDDLQATFEPNESDGKTTIEYGDKKYNVSKAINTPPSAFQYKQLVRAESEKMLFNIIPFTPAGTQLLSIMNIERNYDYIEHFIKQKSQQGFLFEEIKTVS